MKLTSTNDHSYSYTRPYYSSDIAFREIHYFRISDLKLRLLSDPKNYIERERHFSGFAALETSFLLVTSAIGVGFSLEACLVFSCSSQI